MATATKGLLTARQQQALDLLVKFEAEHGREPCDRELAALFDPPISAPSARNLKLRIAARLEPPRDPKADVLKNLLAEAPKFDNPADFTSGGIVGGLPALLERVAYFLDELTSLSPNERHRRDELRAAITAALEAK